MCVCDDVVCERFCVTKLYVRDCVCDKVVCERLCERLCVKDCVCVTTLYAKDYV